MQDLFFFFYKGQACMQDLVLEVYGSKFQVTILQQAFHSYPACDYFKVSGKFFHIIHSL